MFLAYAGCWGQGLIDRAFLPEAWSVDRTRAVQRAGIDDDVAHQPKTELAREMILRALDAGIPAVGSPAMRCMESYRPRASLESGINPMSQRSVVKLISGRVGYNTRCGTSWPPATDPPTAWARLSSRGGHAKDPVRYEWTCQPINTPPEAIGQRYLLVRRTLDEGRLTAYLAFARDVPWPIGLGRRCPLGHRTLLSKETVAAGLGSG